MVLNLLRKILPHPGPIEKAPTPVVPALNQQRYDPGQVHPLKNFFRGFARF